MLRFDRLRSEGQTGRLPATPCRGVAFLAPAGQGRDARGRNEHAPIAGCWFLMGGMVYYFFGLETRGKSNEQIDRELAAD